MVDGLPPGAYTIDVTAPDPPHPSRQSVATSSSGKTRRHRPVPGENADNATPVCKTAQSRQGGPAGRCHDYRDLLLYVRLLERCPAFARRSQAANKWSGQPEGRGHADDDAPDRPVLPSPAGGRRIPLPLRPGGFMRRLRGKPATLTMRVERIHPPGHHRVRDAVAETQGKGFAGPAPSNVQQRRRPRPRCSHARTAHHTARPRGALLLLHVLLQYPARKRPSP